MCVCARSCVHVYIIYTFPSVLEDDNWQRVCQVEQDEEYHVGNIFK